MRPRLAKGLVDLGGRTQILCITLPLEKGFQQGRERHAKFLNWLDRSVTWKALSKLGHCYWQWLRICLPMQGTRVRSLVQEDPTCLGTTKLVCHNY